MNYDEDEALSIIFGMGFFVVNTAVI